MGLLKRPQKVTTTRSDYDSFDQIDGEHPLQQQVEDFCVLYDVRLRPGGKVAYFNFELAKEMGLLGLDHPHKLNKALEQKLLETFGIVIINEYDINHQTRSLKSSSIRSKKFMATRYLQLQHPSRKGKTSGDGRSLWNGTFSAKGTTWDISSCGTGATRLSPATARSNKFFKTGDPSVSYGCGHADLLDGVCSGLMSEIFHFNGIKTERLLCVVEYPGQSAINVRVGKNLLRPSHFFRYLKQGQHLQLSQIANYYIDRQIINEEWPELSGEDTRYDYLLKHVTQTFATISAIFEAEYIFCWLDWDGDNILMDGGIIDYGSVRQFGLYHHEYRYDDVERMSTTLSEQKHKAKYIVKTFAQLVDFLKTKKKRSLKEFDHHPCLNEFNQIFNHVKRDIILKKVGFTEIQRNYLLRYKRELVEHFLQTHSYFESYTSFAGIVETEDGITRNAVFCMRDLLRNYPQQLAEGKSFLEFNEFINLFVSSYASNEDLKRSSYKLKQAKEWQVCYQELIDRTSKKFNISYFDFCRDIINSAQKYNKYAQITGDGIIYVAKEFIRYKNKISFDHYTELAEQFIKDQVIERVGKLSPSKRIKSKKTTHRQFLDKIAKIIVNYREGL